MLSILAIILLIYFIIGILFANAVLIVDTCCGKLYDVDAAEVIASITLWPYALVEVTLAIVELLKEKKK